MSKEIIPSASAAPSTPDPESLLSPEVLRDAHAEKEARDVVVVRRWHRDMTGSITAALVLAQILYWHGTGKDEKIRARVVIDGRVWIRKSRPEWGRECFLTEKETRTAMKTLEGLGIVTIKFFRDGKINRMHLSINGDRYAELRRSIVQVTKSQPKPRGYLKSAEGVPLSQHPLSLSHPNTLLCISEITTESTKTETTVTDTPTGMSGSPPQTDTYLQFAESLIKRTTDELISRLGKEWINQYNPGGVRAGAVASGLTVDQLNRAVDYALQNDFYRDELLNHASFSKGKRWVYLFNKSIQSPPPRSNSKDFLYNQKHKDV